MGNVEMCFRPSWMAFIFKKYQMIFNSSFLSGNIFLVSIISDLCFWSLTAIYILNSQHLSHPVGKISRRVCFVHYPDPEELENARPTHSSLSSQRSGGKFILLPSRIIFYQEMSWAASSGRAWTTDGPLTDRFHCCSFRAEGVECPSEPGILQGGGRCHLRHIPWYPHLHGQHGAGQRGSLPPVQAQEAEGRRAILGPPPPLQWPTMPVSLRFNYAAILFPC